MRNSNLLSRKIRYINVLAVVIERKVVNSLVIDILLDRVGVFISMVKLNITVVS